MAEDDAPISYEPRTVKMLRSSPVQCRLHIVGAVADGVTAFGLGVPIDRYPKHPDFPELEAAWRDGWLIRSAWLRTRGIPLTEKCKVMLKNS